VDEQAPELTHRLFSLGSQLLMQSLPAVLRGSITPSSCTPQDETQASYAPKVCSGQGCVSKITSAVADASAY
jgi:methionyl-tRNA formyltransferase